MLYHSQWIQTISMSSIYFYLYMYAYFFLFVIIHSSSQNLKYLEHVKYLYHENTWPRCTFNDQQNTGPPYIAPNKIQEPPLNWKVKSTIFTDFSIKLNFIDYHCVGRFNTLSLEHQSMITILKIIFNVNSSRIINIFYKYS